MSIGMDRFAAAGSYPTYDMFARVPQATTIFSIQCRCCGFEPEDAVIAPSHCPKCHGQSWERFAKPGSILANAERY
jgi:rubrerythrin